MTACVTEYETNYALQSTGTVPLQPDAPHSHDQKKVELHLHVRWVQNREEGSLQRCTEPSTSNPLHQKGCKLMYQTWGPLECKATDHAHSKYVYTLFFLECSLVTLNVCLVLCLDPFTHARGSGVFLSDGVRLPSDLRTQIRLQNA